MLFSFWILKMLVQYKEATSSSFASCVTYSEYVTHEAFSPLEGGLVIFKMLFWLVLPRDCNWLIKRKLLGVRRIYKERRWEKKCQGHLWHLLESLGAKQIATVQNTGPLSEFQIEWHHAPGGCNYLDICWVITAAIRWFLNYVVDSFMRQWVKTQPEVKSFWPGLRTGWGGVCLQGSKARREPGADLTHEMKADTAAGTEVCLKQIHSQNKFLWQFLKADRPKTNASVGNLDEWQQLHFSWERIWVLTQIFKKCMKIEESNCWTI